MKTIKKIIMIFSIASLVFLFIYECALLLQNKNKLKRIEASVVSIEDIKIETHARASDSMTISMTLCYEENDVVTESNFKGTVYSKEKKEMLLSLKEGDKISVYSNVFGLSFDNGYLKIWLAIIADIGLLIICLVELISKDKKGNK